MAVRIGFSPPSLTTSNMRWGLLKDQHRSSYSHGRHHDYTSAAAALPVSLSSHGATLGCEEEDDKDKDDDGGLSGSSKGLMERGNGKGDGIGDGSVKGDCIGIGRWVIELNGENEETEFVNVGRIEEEEKSGRAWRTCVDPSAQEELEVAILLDNDCHGIKKNNIEDGYILVDASSMTKASSFPLEETNIDPGILMHLHHNPNCNSAHLIPGEVSPPSSYFSSPSSSLYCVGEDNMKMDDSKMNLVVDPPNNDHVLRIWDDHHLPLPYASTIAKASSSPLEEAKIDQGKMMHTHHSPIYNAPHHMVDEVSSSSPHYVAKDQVVDPPNKHHQDVRILGNHHLPSPCLVDDGDDRALPCAKRNINRKLSRVVEESESFLRREFGPSSLEAMSYMNCTGNVGWTSSTTSASMKTSSSWDVAPRSFPKMAVFLLRRGMSDSTILREKSTSRGPNKKEDKKIEAHSNLRTNLDNSQQKKKSSKRRVTTTSTSTSMSSLVGFLWPLKKVRDTYVSCMMGLEDGATNNVCIISNGLASHHHHFPNRLHY